MDTEFPSFQFQAPAVLLTEAKMARRGLMEQDLSKLDVTKLHPLSPEVISRQATINIGNATSVVYAVLIGISSFVSKCACIYITVTVLASYRPPV